MATSAAKSAFSRDSGEDPTKERAHTRSFAGRGVVFAQDHGRAHDAPTAASEGDATPQVEHGAGASKPAVLPFIEMPSALLRGVAGGALLLFGWSAYTEIANVTTFSCTRSTGFCVLEKETPGSTSSIRIPLADLTGAELEDYRTAHPNAPGSSRSKSARLMLLTKRASVPFMDWYSGVGMDEMAAHKGMVEAFLKQPGQPSLRIQRDDRRMAALTGAVPFLLGLGLMISVAVGFRRWGYD
jgi:hypothetical protein